MKDLLTTDFRNAPYWWDAAPLTESAGGALAPSYDVVIVGSGYTGLRAALTLARAGRSVAVFDKERPGYGASRRNAGFLGRTLKKSYVDLKAAKGAAHASAIYRDLMMAYESTLAFIEEEGIDCHAVRCGRLIAATSAAHYAELERELAGMKADLGLPYAMLPRARLREEMATDLYDGGAVIPDLGSLHPGLYHRGLMERALAAGVAIFGNCEVTAVEQAGQGANASASPPPPDRRARGTWWSPPTATRPKACPGMPGASFPSSATWRRPSRCRRRCWRSSFRTGAR